MTTKPLSTIDEILDEYGVEVLKFEFNEGNIRAKAQLRSLVEKNMYELIGEDEPGGTVEINSNHQNGYHNELRAEQRQNIPKLLDQMFGGRDE